MDFMEFLNKVDPFTDFQEDSNNYRLIKVDDIKTDTAKAAFIQLEGEIHHAWVPYSVLRCSSDGDVYMAEWFYRKNF